MSVQWYFRQAGHVNGPYSSSQLKQLADKGHITAETEVRREQDTRWIMAAHVKGLFQVATLPISTSARGSDDVAHDERAVGTPKWVWAGVTTAVVGIVALGIAILVSAQRRATEDRVAGYSPQTPPTTRTVDGDLVAKGLGEMTTSPAPFTTEIPQMDGTIGEPASEAPTVGAPKNPTLDASADLYRAALQVLTWQPFEDENLGSEPFVPDQYAIKRVMTKRSVRLSYDAAENVKTAIRLLREYLEVDSVDNARQRDNATKAIQYAEAVISDEKAKVFLATLDSHNRELLASNGMLVLSLQDLSILGDGFGKHNRPVQLSVPWVYIEQNSPVSLNDILFMPWSFAMSDERVFISLDRSASCGTLIDAWVATLRKNIAKPERPLDPLELMASHLKQSLKLASEALRVLDSEGESARDKAEALMRQSQSECFAIQTEELEKVWPGMKLNFQVYAIAVGQVADALRRNPTTDQERAQIRDGRQAIHEFVRVMGNQR